MYSQAKSAAAFGVNVQGVSYDLATAMKRKRQVVDRLRRGVEFTLKKGGVTVVKAAATILPSQGETLRVQAGAEILEGRRLLICSGSETVRPPIPGLDQPWVLTSKEMLELPAIPENLVVIGAGAIGLELAQFCAEAGSRVTVVEMLPQIGGSIDPSLAAVLKSELERKGILFHLEAKVTAVGDHTVRFSSEKLTDEIRADVVLLSVGRRPVVKGFGVENIGVKVERGAIVTDVHGRTSVPNVWAAGDANGQLMLAHTAYREADVCIADMLGQKDSVRYDAIPFVIYTHPEIAAVGLTEAQARELSYTVRVAELPMAYSGRFLAETEKDKGVCRVVIDDETKRILGVHMLGGGCSEMIFGAAVMIAQNMTVADADRVVFPHPTVSEVIRETVRQF
jgi:dihydrolipoamide dehydrogenase